MFRIVLNAQFIKQKIIIVHLSFDINNSFTRYHILSSTVCPCMLPHFFYSTRLVCDSQT